MQIRTQTKSNQLSNEMPVLKTIQAGPYHCAALTDDGRVFAWGKGKHGVLGQGDEENHYEPVQVVTTGDCQVRIDVWKQGLTCVWFADPA